MPYSVLVDGWAQVFASTGWVVALVVMPRLARRRPVRPCWFVLRDGAFVVPADAPAWRLAASALMVATFGIYLWLDSHVITRVCWFVIIVLVAVSAGIEALTRYPIALTPQGVTTWRFARPTIVTWDELSSRQAQRRTLRIFSGLHPLGMPWATVERTIRHYADSPSERERIGTTAEFDRLEAIVSAAVAADAAIPQPSEPLWDPWRDRDGISS